jgi:hypothetical protein
VSLNSISNAYLGNLSFVLHYANTTRITCANFTIAQGEILPTQTSAVLGSILASATGFTTEVTTTVVVGFNSGPAGWPSGVPYPPTAAPGWPSGAPFGGNGLGGWGAWGFTGQSASPVPIVAAGSGVVSSAVPTLSAAVGVSAAAASSSFVAEVASSSLPPLPGTVTGASTPKGTGFIPTAAAVVEKTSDGIIEEWSKTLLSVAGLFALTMVF